MSKLLESKKMIALLLGIGVLVGYIVFRFLNGSLASLDSTFMTCFMILFGAYLGGQGLHDFKHGDHTVREEDNGQPEPDPNKK